jgi:hypothetical protein
MIIRQDIADFIDQVNSFSRKRLQNRLDISILLQLSRDGGKEDVFDDLTFHAKYIHRVFGILGRTTPDSETYPKLSSEFNDGIEKVGTLIRTLIKEGPEEIKRRFTETYFDMTHESLRNLLGLSYDLSWVKNWNIDKGTDGG